LAISAGPQSLLQPELHVHHAVHCGGGGKVLVSLLAYARAPVQRAETKVIPSNALAAFKVVPGSNLERNYPG
jgi:hypothetical protein